MAVYREGFYAVEQITKASVRIFPDAADYGAPTKQGDKIWQVAKQLVEWYGEKDTREENRYSTGRSVTSKVTLIDEWAVSDGRKSMEQATITLTVSFVSCTTGKCEGYDGYVSIDH